MNSLEKNNVKLLNLVEKGHSFRQINRLLESKINNDITEVDFIEILGDTPMIHKIISDFKCLDYSFYSIYCLLFFGINIITVEKLKLDYDNLKDLSIHIELLEEMGYQQRTIEKIVKALNELGLNYCSDVKNTLLMIITDKQPIQNNQLKNIVLNSFNNLNAKIYDEVINDLITDGLIILTINGYKIPFVSIHSFFKKNKDLKNSIVHEKLQGKTLQDIADTRNVSRERIRQIIENTIIKYPKFKDEDKYFSILSEYHFCKEDMEILNFDTILMNYVCLKNKFKASKGVIDYLIENNLYQHDYSKKLFKKYNVAVIDKEIIQLNFLSLFKKYLYSKGIYNFDLLLIKDYFNQYLEDKGINCKECLIEDDIEEKSRKLINSENFVNVNKLNFMVFDINALSYEFLSSTNDFIDSFRGYGSVEIFYKNNKKLCQNNHIYNENDLFAILKRLYFDEKKNKVIFIRTPIIMEKGVDKNAYIENMILDMDLPCTVEAYVKYVCSVTGLKYNTFMSSFSNIINKYKNVDGLLTLDDDYSPEEEACLRKLLNDQICIGYDYYTLSTKRLFKDRSYIFNNANTLRKFGYILTNTTIYKDIYSSRKFAVKEALKGMGHLLSEGEVNKICNSEYLVYKLYDAIDECFVIKLSDNKYLNNVAREQQYLFQSMQQTFDSFFEKDKIYTLDKAINSLSFRKIIDSNEDYKYILNVFNEREIIRFLLKTNRNFSCVESFGSFVFSKGELSLKKIIEKIITQYKVLYKNEFHEILYDEYGIDKKFSNNEFSEFGFYCPFMSEKIYLNAEIYEIDMKEYFNESIGFND